MQIIWEQKSIRAIDIYESIRKQTVWQKSTVYTLINRLLKKGVIKRTDPGFICEPLINKSDIKILEAKGLINKIYSGSINKLVSAFLENDAIDEAEFKQLKELIKNNAEKFERRE